MLRPATRTSGRHSTATTLATSDPTGNGRPFRMNLDRNFHRDSRRQLTSLSYNPLSKSSKHPLRNISLSTQYLAEVYDGGYQIVVSQVEEEMSQQCGYYLMHKIFDTSSGR
ncbi:hypothetical protein RR48_09938 [Papilio machaon]|uniref:Uncharacterized protein n=1 Tax=Papilio machaon TaxID=76193 RepID=A0A194RE71_PAPMA|nr:hypothetical protein RR48_09938 [Papilio machaon]